MHPNYVALRPAARVAPLPSTTEVADNVTRTTEYAKREKTHGIFHKCPDLNIASSTRTPLAYFSPGPGIKQCCPGLDILPTVPLCLPWPG